MSSCRFDSLLAMATTREGAVTTFYRGPDVLITRRVLIWRSPQPQTFAIRELRDVHIVIAETPGTMPRLILRGRRHSLELHAFRGNERVCLFRTTDPRLFGQIRRALVRALEAHADHRVSP
jgi:hypothetical protein